MLQEQTTQPNLIFTIEPNTSTCFAVSLGYWLLVIGLLVLLLIKAELIEIVNILIQNLNNTQLTINSHPLTIS